MRVEPRPPRLVVIGGGFSAAAFAIHFLRDHGSRPVEILLVDDRARVGAGRAYDTAEPTHRINVDAGRMSLFAETPDDFVRWLGQHGDGLAADGEARMPDGRLYPQRGLFGAYVADTLDRVGAAGGPGRVRHLRDRAVGAVRAPAGGFRVELRSGDTLDADILLLANGHPPPSTPPVLAALAPPSLIADPWVPDALAPVATRDEVLILGTGLTACDVIATLERRGHTGAVLALSRRGLLPRPRTTRPVAPFGDFAATPADTARALVAAVRAAVAEVERRDRPWEDVIAALREQGSTVWNALPLLEQKRLLRHARPFWDVHRFQSAPPVDAALARMRADGRLTVIAGRVLDAAPAGDRVALRIAPRGGNTPVARTVDHLVDCTGPGHRSVVADDELLRALAAAGLIRPDATRLGLDTDRSSRALAGDGCPNRDILVLGPLARAAHGELMGLPQVAAQPRAVAAALAASPLFRAPAEFAAP